MQFSIFSSSSHSPDTFSLFIFFVDCSFVYGFCALKVRTARAVKALTYEHSLCMCVCVCASVSTAHACEIDAAFMSVYQCIGV